MSQVTPSLLSHWQEQIHHLKQKEYPAVSVIIPALNESKSIVTVIQYFLDSAYPNILEILIADGGSTDGTQALVSELAKLNPQVKLLENRQRITPAALNLLIHAAQGDIILRADAHSDYGANYVSACVEALLKTDALNVGGAQRFVAEGQFQAGVAIAARSLLGNGGAKYRQPDYDGYADTVYLGCFWRVALIAVGESKEKFVEGSPGVLEIYDHTQITNQDAELNQQLLRLSQQAIFVSSKIQSWYYPRQTWQSLWQQYFKYGRGRFLTASKHRRNRPLRTKIPAFCFIGVASLLLLDGLFFQFRLHSYWLLALAFLILGLESWRVNWQIRTDLKTEVWRGQPDQIPSFFSRVWNTGLAIGIMPIAYVLGNFYQTYRCRLRGVSGW